MGPEKPKQIEPYKGLRPYEEENRDIFFGRDQEREILIDKLFSNKLTLLFAATGVGKSSLLQAAVMPELKRPERLNLDVVYYMDWVSNPIEGLKQKTIQVLRERGKVGFDYQIDEGASLKDFFQLCSTFASEPLVVILDQFEEFFQYRRYQEDFLHFVKEFSQCVVDRVTPTAFIISMREDFALELNVFKDYLPTTLFENYFRLEKLNEEKAREAISRPVERFGFNYEEKLLDALLKDLAEREKEAQLGTSPAALVKDMPSYVEPPYLQIVCSRLWEADSHDPERKIRFESYDKMGRAKGFVDSYFNEVMNRFSLSEKKISSLAFDHLVTPRGTKMAYTAGDLCDRIMVNEKKMEKVLEKLRESRILRSQKREGVIWYELYHDVFSNIIYQWNKKFKKRQFNKLLFITITGLIFFLLILFSFFIIIPNITNYYFRADFKMTTSNNIEIYRGKLGTEYMLDLRRYRAEIVSPPQDMIELYQIYFHKEQISDFNNLNEEFICLLAVKYRISVYWEAGEIKKAWELANDLILEHDIISQQVIDVLAIYGFRKSYEILKKNLDKTENPYKRQQIVDALALMPPSLIMEDFIDLLNDERFEVRRKAVSVLGKIGSKKALSELIRLLKDPDHELWMTVAGTLVENVNEKSMKLLIQLLKNPNRKVRSGIAKVLGKVDSEKSEDLLIQLLKDVDWEVQESAINAIGEIGSEKAVISLIKILKDPDFLVKSSAAEALGEIGSEKAVPPLINLLEVPNSTVKSSTVEALGNIGSEKAINSLIERLRDPDEKVQLCAAFALVAIDSDKAMMPIHHLSKDWDYDAWISLREFSDMHVSDQAVTLLLRLLKEPYSDVRLRAVEVYGKLGSEQAVMPLLQLLKEPHSNGRTGEEMYRVALRKTLGHIDLLGSPDIENKPVKLEDAFVSLCISESWRSEERFEPRKKMEEFYDRHLTPEQVMKRAFQKYRLLLIIGDPGSGKTTLLKYLTISCLNKKCKHLGFKEDIFPIYFPLRELHFGGENNEPSSLPQNLEKWSERHLLDISASQFHDWLQKRRTLVLLDGLDEISSKEQRRKVSRWVKDMCTGLQNACFVMTSRATGYRKLDGIELEVPHLRADIMDFSPEQQEVFLKKWFRVAGKAQLSPPDLDIPEKEWQARQEKEADRRSETIIEFLRQEDNNALRELATVPMLLQIMAIIWKYSQYLPQSRSELYDAALNYLLDYRDRHRNIYPLLRAEKARLVLKYVALWIQEKLKKDEVPKEKMHDYMQPILNTLDERPQASAFCDSLRERAGVIAEYDKNHYIFRHRSFREFLAALQLAKEAQQKKRIKTLVKYFKEDWWEETLRFFITQTDDEMFNSFMFALFQSPVSRHLDDNKQTLLLNLVTEAPQKAIAALEKWLNSDKLNDNQRRYVMDCLKTIATPDALAAIKNADKTNMDKLSREYAEEIITEAAAKTVTLIEITGQKDLGKLNSFRSLIEGGAEYIKIPGGSYKYSATGEKVTAPDLYICKYPVTNQRYRRFIAYLQGKDKEFEKMLPVDKFAQKLLKFAESIKGYSEYLGKKPKKWQEELRSTRDDDKKFNGDDRPVVSVTWYAARAYCFWLSCLDAAIKGNSRLEDIAIPAETYRLPTEVEWEWAAGGNPDGSMRTYPWAEEKGEPNSKLANYDKNVCATTPVGRYPKGATPHGLMDMAGNVWEWMDNLYWENRNLRALRGGSWNSGDQFLRCSTRNDESPDLGLIDVGFRVVRSLV